jgi:hypothetical protein
MVVATILRITTPREYVESDDGITREISDDGSDS